MCEFLKCAPFCRFCFGYPRWSRQCDKIMLVFLFVVGATVLSFSRARTLARSRAFHAHNSQMNRSHWFANDDIAFPWRLFVCNASFRIYITECFECSTCSIVVSAQHTALICNWTTLLVYIYIYTDRVLLLLLLLPFLLLLFLSPSSSF